MIDVASFGSVYQDHVVEAGKEPAFLFLVSFLASWVFIRTSAHMIRAQVSWWPGNVEVGGTHIHHLVWGIIILMVTGWVAIAFDPGSPGREIAAVAFGFGTGLTLDEFALWLELKDVYWEEQGRKSIDAVIVAAILAGFGVLGLTIWVDAADDVATAVQAVVGFFGLLGLLLAGVNFAKEKLGMGVVGLFIPLVSIIGALRLGRPHSPWARLFYRSEGKRRRAEERFEGKRGLPIPHRRAHVEEQAAPAVSEAGEGSAQTGAGDG